MKRYKKITLDGLDESVFHKYLHQGLILSGPIYKKQEKDFVARQNYDENLNELSEYVRHQTGSFKFIFSNANTLIIGTDQFRSLPVYFSFKNNNLDVFYESNSYKKKSFSLSKRKIKELESSGATLGRNSIAKGFYSLNPGEMLAINLKSKKFIIRKYFSFKYQFTNLEKDRHFNKIDETFNKIFLSLRSIAKDRRILIPLSGGYDSRLIACQLKKHHFKNILAFTYGSSDKSSEAIISKKIADNLNIPWVFIKYDNKSWDKQSDYEFSKYLNSTFDFSSLPHYQDFLAIYFAKQRGILKDDDILMPGHSGDMLAGSHFLKIDDGRFYELSDVAKMLEQDIFNFKKNKLHRVIRSHLFLNSGKKNDTGINCQVNAMKLDFELRQSKYIINSVRVYEYFDIDWWLPLWDIRLVDYFLSLQREELVKANYYDKYVNYLYSNVSKKTDIIPHNQKTKFKTFLKNFETKFFKFFSKYSIYHYIKAYRKFFFSSLGYRGLILSVESLRILNGSSHQSIIVKKILKNIKSSNSSYD